MKTLLLTAFLSLGFLLSSYTLQTQDGIPELNKKVIEYINTKINKKVATGECWDVAAEALKYAGATWDGMYKFGKEVNYKKEPMVVVRSWAPN